MRKIKIILVLVILLTSVTSLQTSLSKPILVYAKPADINCLAQNIYHESRSESIEGQIAVAQVTVNRVKASNFNKNICDVVFQPKQFSWTLNKHVKIKDSKAWKASLVIAKAVLTNSIRMPNFTATHYHTTQVNPRWNKDKIILAIIGKHIFYA